MWSECSETGLIIIDSIIAKELLKTQSCYFIMSAESSALFIFETELV